MRITVSIVLPFYNEEANVERVVTDLLQATGADNGVWNIDLICVQNGSRDGTGQVLSRLAQADKRVKVVEVPVNRGYGYGIRQGLASATGNIVGYLDGDGQVRPADILRVLAGTQSCRAAKARRAIRGDGCQRRFVSMIYNTMFRGLFAVQAGDANAKPKFLRKEDLAKLALVSDDWFIDAEVMIKTAALGIKWAEEPVEFRKRDGGRSNVRIGSIIEFLRNLGRWRFGPTYKAWKRTTLQS
jgi:glycosyltransferase involved in cell wall biosynthesis